MNNRTLILMQGVPGSGKSTVANMIDMELGARGREGVILSTDEYWYTVMGDDKGSYNYDSEKLTAAHQWNQQRCVTAMAYDTDYIIIDNTNIKGEHALPYLTLAKIFNYEVLVVSVDPGLEVALERNEARTDDRRVPEETIRRMYTEMERLMT